MNNTLMTYLSKRLHQNDPKYPATNIHPGPVICISREVGCGGVAMAKSLAAELDKLTFCKRWKVLSKEILEESARELNMETSKLRNIMKEADRGAFDDILSAFSEKRYKSDRKINKTIIELISSFANEGHYIIVGRAGHIIARDIEKSLFIKLTAPHDWRVKQIMEKNNLNMREAIDFIDKTEKERQSFIKRIATEINVEVDFDLTINLSKLTTNDAIDLIKHVAQTKGLIEPNKSKIEVF